MKLNSRLEITCAILLWFFLVVAGPARAATMVDRIVAVVNGEIITLYELNQEVQSTLATMKADSINEKQVEGIRSRVLQSMVNDLLLKQEAERFEISVSDVEVENRLDQIRQQRDLSQEDFQKLLDRQGMTLAEYKDRIREDIKKNRVLSSMVRQKVVVTEQEMQEYYQNNLDAYTKPRSVHLRLLLMQDRQELLSLRDRIRSGELSFTQAAREHSQGPGADQGGDLGRMDWADLANNWKEALKSVSADEMSDIFPLRGQFALLYVEKIHSGGTRPLEEVRDQIRDRIYARKLEDRYQEYIQSLRSKAVLDVRL
jgi:peptidyl-prolyl cis-trans isomerase SurA